MPGSSVALHVREQGAGSPVVLLHGLAGDHTVWNGVLGPLGSSRRWVAPDLRGHGRSPVAPDGAYDLGAHVDDLLALLDGAGIERTGLVGVSAGALLALQLAHDHPDRVASLVVIGGSPHCDAHTRAVIDGWAEAFRDGGPDAYALRLLKDLFAPDWIEQHFDFADEVRARQAAVDPAPSIAWGTALRAFDLRGKLHRLAVPALVMHGMDDLVVDPSHGRMLRQSIWGSELKLFANTGHLVPIEHPQECASAIDAWLGRVERGEVVRPNRP